MAARTKQKGRPRKEEGKRDKIVNVRFTEAEYKSLADLEKTLGLTKTELIRRRVLENAGHVVINANELLGKLDLFGSELGRIGNNINQLARHANTLRLQQALNPEIISHFERQFDEYLRIQQLLEISLRRVIRLMGK